MGALIWIGAILSLTGVGLLVWCIARALAIRTRAVEDETATRTGLQRLVVVNFAALGLSAIGLMLVVIGVLMG